MPPMRRLAETTVLTLCGLLLLHAFVITLCQVPGGSMAPTLHGRHRVCTCPRCGLRVTVGHGRGRSYDHAACPNCDFRPLPLDGADQPGDQLWVLQPAFLWWPPARWEIIVFRWLGELFIKRVVGLPGETVAVHGGDVYVNGELVRKSLAEARALRVLVFDGDCMPRPQTWAARWRTEPGYTGKHPLTGTELHLGGERDGKWQTFTYEQVALDDGKAQPLADEYAYNGGEPTPITFVHDFLVECEVEVLAPTGALLVGLTDGQDTVIAEVAISGADQPSRLRVTGAATSAHELTGAGLLQPGRSHRLEFAFVDRRAMLAIDGREPFAALDLPPATHRAPVTRPLLLGVKDGRVVVRHLRLYRDLHYTDTGRNAVRGQVVRLGPDQYFVLGDNSPLSEDSRFWPGNGTVSSAQLVGRPLGLPGGR